MMMNEANTMVRWARRAATAAFDAVTAQSPSVQLAAESVRVMDFSQSMDLIGAIVVLGAAAITARGRDIHRPVIGGTGP